MVQTVRRNCVQSHKFQRESSSPTVLLRPKVQGKLPVLCRNRVHSHVSERVKFFNCLARTKSSRKTTCPLQKSCSVSSRESQFLRLPCSDQKFKEDHLSRSHFAIMPKGRRRVRVDPVRSRGCKSDLDKLLLMAAW